MTLETLADGDFRKQILPKHYHSQLIIKLESVELSILFNPVVGLPDLYISSNFSDTMGLALTPKEHPVDNKVMFWLHECNFDKALPQLDQCPNVLVLWLSTLVENVFVKAADSALNNLRHLVGPKVVKSLEKYST